jgi:hypothetical protein
LKFHCDPAHLGAQTVGSLLVKALTDTAAGTARSVKFALATIGCLMFAGCGYFIQGTPSQTSETGGDIYITIRPATSMGSYSASDTISYTIPPGPEVAFERYVQTKNNVRNMGLSINNRGSPTPVPTPNTTHQVGPCVECLTPMPGSNPDVGLGIINDTDTR